MDRMLPAVLLCIASATAAAVEDPIITTSALALSETSAPADLTLAAVGDMIYVQPMLPLLEKQAPQILTLLRGADVTFGNFEATALDIDNFSGYPEADSGGAWIVASERVPMELRSMGFDLVSVANNHALDWGVAGMDRSMDLLAEAGLIYAGAGHSLSAARAARYFASPAGRVALNAATSTFPARSRASDAFGRVNSRPGVNGLRLQSAAETPPNTLHMNMRDRRETLRAIHQGKLNSHLSIVSLHTHEFGNDVTVPAKFAVEFAHDAIDAGADSVVGHGVHQLQGIEIYNGRPIFYSLGNFFFALDALDVVPVDMYEDYDIDPAQMTAAEFMRHRNRLVHSVPRRYESVIAVVRYVQGQAVEIRLYPIELGYSSSTLDRGLPRMASAAVGRRILDGLQQQSKPLGTKVLIKGNVGVIEIASVEGAKGKH